MEFLVLVIYAWVLLKEPEPHQIEQTPTEEVRK